MFWGWGMIFRNSNAESGTQFFVIVKVVLHTLDVLIRLVPLACHENNIARGCQHHGCANGLAAVCDADDLLALFGIKSGEHIVDDVLRLFKARIVARDDDAFAALGSFACHQRSFSLVPVAASSAYGDDLRLASHDFADGTQHIGQASGVWA